MFTSKNLFVIITIVFSVYSEQTYAQQAFRLQRTFQDNMVLQRAPYKAQLAGFGENNAEVTVTVNGKSFKTIVVNDKWAVQMDPIEATNTPIVIDITHKSPSGTQATLKLNNVLFGDVYVCSGQSNMVWPMRNTLNNAPEIAKSVSFNNIRIFQVNTRESTTVESELQAAIGVSWSVASTKLSAFSAVCWFFGKELNKRLNVPIGLISSAVGGTRIEKWMADETFAKCKTPRSSNDATHWNAMINPLTSHSIYGAIWYQGESNTGYNRQVYGCNFAEMVANWRLKWSQNTNGATNPNFPFGFVQIANSGKGDTTISGYPATRIQQTYGFGYVPNAKLQNIFMATAIDLVEPDTHGDQIHPRMKDDVGLRLALGALNIGYNQKTVHFAAPRVESVTYTNPNININFVQVDFGSVSLKKLNDKGLEVCCDSEKCLIDENNNWSAVNAIKIAGASVIFEKPTNCKQPKAVRYLWRNKPCAFKSCALYCANSDLPVPPFISPISQ